VGPDIDAAIKQQAWYIYRRGMKSRSRCQPTGLFGAKRSNCQTSGSNYDSVIDSVEIFDHSPSKREKW